MLNKKTIAVLLLLLSLAGGWLGFAPSSSVPPVLPQTAAHPAPESAGYVLTDKRRVHILYGDETGGGHKAGMGKPGKSEFPANWDENKIIASAIAVANDDSLPLRPSGRYFLKMGEVDGLKIRVVVNRDAHEIITAYPLTRKNKD